MILAAADAATIIEKQVWKDGGWITEKRKKGQPPYELKLAWQCRQFNCLPMSGGLLNQPAGLIDRMQIAYNIWEAVETRKKYGEEQAKFIKDRPDEFALCQMVEELRNAE